MMVRCVVRSLGLNVVLTTDGGGLVVEGGVDLSGVGNGVRSRVGGDVSEGCAHMDRDISGGNVFAEAANQSTVFQRAQ